MGSKRIGLARVEKMLENLKRDIAWGPGTTFNGGADLNNSGIPCTQYGLMEQWNTNFGSELAGADPEVSTLNVLTSGVVAFNLSRALEGIASQTDAPSAAHASAVFGGTGVAGADVAIGTTASPGQTPTVTQKIHRLTGGVSGTVTMSAGADLTTKGDETLILFTGNTFDSTGILKLTLHSNNSLDAESSEVWVTADGTNVLTRQGAFTDGNNTIVLTDTGDCTILAGSYVYLHAGHNSNVMCCKAVIRTTGGTIAVTDAS